MGDTFGFVPGVSPVSSNGVGPAGRSSKPEGDVRIVGRKSLSGDWIR
jgi:hypothetical protein